MSVEISPISIGPFHPGQPGGELAGVIALLAAALPGDPISSTRFTRQVMLDPNFDPEGALVARDGEKVMGFCLAMARRVPMENAAPDSDRGYITLLAVNPASRRQGIGARLVEAAESYLRARDRSLVLVSPYAPGYFTPGVDVDACAPALSLFKGRGYVESYRAISMEASLWSGAVPEWILRRKQTLASEGIVVEPYTPDRSLAVLEFAHQEFPGHWVRVLREGMGSITEGQSSSRIMTARSGERIVGFSHHENERFGPIGVAAGERGRGIGQVLMFETLRAMRESGFRTAWFLRSDERTARRLYDSASFRVVRTFSVLRKEL